MPFWGSYLNSHTLLILFFIISTLIFQESFYSVFLLLLFFFFLQCTFFGWFQFSLKLLFLFSAVFQKLFYTKDYDRDLSESSAKSFCLFFYLEASCWLQSMGLLRVGHDWATSLSLFTFMHWRRKWQPTPVFLPGESQGWGAWWAAVYGVAQSRTRLKRLSSSSSSRGFLKCVLYFVF